MNSRTINLKGEQGGQYYDTAATHTPSSPATSWGAIMCVTDVVASAIVQPGFTDASKLATLTLSAGYVIYGPTTSITLTSGTIQCFYNIDPKIKTNAS